MDSRSGHIQVLHVDDDPDFAKMAGNFIQREDDGIHVDSEPSVREGLERLADTQYDCVVSDYDMATRNGIEFLEEVRETQPDLPFILYTGKGSEAIASDAISAGVTDYLQKGAGTSQYAVLANRIRNAVNNYRAQKELSEREKRLNLFFEQSPLGVIEWDAQFDFVRMNDAAEETLGYSGEDLDGESWERIVSKADQSEVGSVVADLLENKGGYHIVNENVRKDGETIICEWHNRVVTDQDGDVIAIFSQFQDITDRREQERRFEAVFNNTYTFTGLTHPDGTVIEANETALSFGGLEREDVVGESVWDTGWFQSNEESQAMVREAVEQARNGDLYRDEVQIQGEDSEAVIDFSIRPITDEQGDVTLLVPEGRNITQRKQQERRAQQRRYRLEQILKTVPTCVVQLDDGGQFVFANERAEEILGLEASTLTERAYNDPEWNITDLDGNPIPDEELPFRKVMETGERVHDCRHTITWPDGTQKILSVNGAPLFDEDGVVESVVFALADITAREEQQTRLKTTSARLEALYENSPDLINVLTPDGRLRDVNQRFSEELGYTVDELIGTPIWEIDRLVSPDDFESVLSDLEQGDRRKFEGLYERKDGSTLPVEVHLLRLNLNDEDRFLAISRDNTERKRQTRHRNQIIDRVTDAIVEVDSDWRFTLLNDQAEELYEMAESDVLGRSFWDVFAEAQGTRFEDVYRRVMKTREPASLTEYYTGLSGWFDIDVYPTDDGGIAFYFREVTDRVERSRQVQRQSERFEYVEEVAEIGYWEIDAQTSDPREVTLSDGVYDIHDLSPDEPFDVETGLQFYHPEDRPEVERAIEQAHTEAKPYEYQARLLTAADRERWVRSVGEPVEEDGEVVQVRGVFQDVTELEEKKQALARQNERLENFARFVTHDLQSPLSVAEGNLELAQDDRENEYLTDARKAIERCQTLIDDLLLIAREGDDVNGVEPVSLERIAHDCWENVQTVDATLVVETEKTIEADYKQLQQLVENLIRNAVEHGGEEVTVTIGETDAGFYFEDDGRGIPEADRQSVFELGHSTKEHGTGFGLGIASRVAKAHDWELRITDSDGGGARFEVANVKSPQT